MQTEFYGSAPTPVGVDDPHLIVLDCDRLQILPLKTKQVWRIGRANPANPDIALHSSIVSREHGWIQYQNGTWYYLDHPNNTNGTFYNGRKLVKTKTFDAVPLRTGDMLRIDSAQPGTHNKDSVLMLFSTMPEQGQWTFLSLQGKSQVTIGRDPTSDIVEPFPYISARHARIQYRDGRYILSDTKSRAGTFLNGKLVTGPVALEPKDCISICGRNIFFMGSQLLYAAMDVQKRRHFFTYSKPHERPVVLSANIISKTVKSNTGSGTKELIRDINLQIREGSLVALLGSAGAGKTTVMNCLNGMELTGVQGSVIYRNVDLTQNFEQMMHMIGSVPQVKTFRPNFTPRWEFYIAAKKRLPADTSTKEINERVENTLNMLHINGVANSRNRKLSGGEQTRVNIGIELVADRDLLCLDEPDQGLSPNYKHELFQIMQDLAHKNGKSILAIVHDVSEIDMFDQVIMLGKLDGVGRLAFSGTPSEARQYFGVTDFADVYKRLEENPSRYIRR